jgi:RNA polymerase sigma-70 factor (ECF subfamily)
MTEGSRHDRLSGISTSWTVLRQAWAGAPQEAAAAQQLLMERYGGAVRRYLLRIVGDPHAADDLSQEFALGLVQRRFQGADPERGRFRDYVKGILAHLVSHHYQRQKRRPRSLPAGGPEPALEQPPSEELESAFREAWRDQMLSRTWDVLADAYPASYTVLRLRTTHPGLSSAKLAERLSEKLGKHLTPEGARQAVHRARERFADLLLEEIARTVEPPTPDALEEELRDQDLLVYCQAALERYRRGREGWRLTNGPPQTDREPLAGSPNRHQELAVGRQREVREARVLLGRVVDPLPQRGRHFLSPGNIKLPEVASLFRGQELLSVSRENRREEVPPLEGDRVAVRPAVGGVPEHNDRVEPVGGVGVPHVGDGGERLAVGRKSHVADAPQAGVPELPGAPVHGVPASGGVIRR